MEPARIADMQELCNLLIDNGYRLIKVSEVNSGVKMVDERNSGFGKTVFGSGTESDFSPCPCNGFGADFGADSESCPVPFGDSSCDDFQTVGPFGSESSDTFQEDPIMEKEMQQARRRAELIKLEKEVDNPKLVTALRKWRRAKAQLQNVPAFYVLANKTLLMIALVAPSTMEELLSVKGFGPVLAEKYGQELLDLIAGVMEVEEVDSPLIE